MHRALYKVFYRGEVDIVAHRGAGAAGGECVHLLFVPIARGGARAAGKGIVGAVFGYVLRDDAGGKVNVAGALFGARELLDAKVGVRGEGGARPL